MKTFASLLLILALSLFTVTTDAKEICLQSVLSSDFLKLTGGKPDKKPYIGTYYCSVGGGAYALQPLSAIAIKNADGTYRITIIVQSAGAVADCVMWIDDIVGDKDFNGTGIYDYSRFGQNLPDGTGTEQLANVNCSALPTGSVAACGAIAAGRRVKSGNHDQLLEREDQ